jgi:MFS family permease
MGGILTLKVFLDAFPMINPDAAGITDAESSTRSTYQGIAVASYNLGCFIGAVITIFIGNPLGRKRVIMLGTAIMVIGAILQASATTLEQFIVGRIITGLGNGGNTSTVSSCLGRRIQRIDTNEPPRSPHGSPKHLKPTNAARWS